MLRVILPEFVSTALNQLRNAGFEAYAVGGCVRDLLIGREPKDYDITTNANPEEIQKVFKDTLYNNNFGTVAVRIIDQTSTRHEIEVTPYRLESHYTDKRHPDRVVFGKSLKEDLARRDFTVNAMATDGKNLVDPFNGAGDCSKKNIRCVGEPKERFQEDALRMLRAPRFAAQLSFQVEESTFTAIKQNASEIKHISGERVRDELNKIILSDDSFRGFWLCHTSELLVQILSELEETSGVRQNLHHLYTVFTHCLFSLQFCPSDDLLTRWGALLHDIGKTQTKQGDYPSATFYQHEHVGAKIAENIFRRLKFSRRDIERIGHYVRTHMFYYSIGEITDAGVRRLIKRIGRENIDVLMAIRIGDRMGSGCQKEKPFKLVELERRMRIVEKDPMDVTMLKVSGHDVMEIGMVPEGRKVGEVLQALLEEVLEDPSLNDRDYLINRIQEFIRK